MVNEEVTVYPNDPRRFSGELEFVEAPSLEYLEITDGRLELTYVKEGNVSSYVVKAPRTSTKRFSVMRFDSSHGIDFKSWTQAKMERENNWKLYRTMEVDAPRYGGGSEFRQEEKAGARRKRLGIRLKQYRQEDQPWILTVSGKKEKKYKGSRAGGVSENSSWYIFMQGKDGAFEAYPVEEWYCYRPVQHYRSLTEEEAEKHFERRSKIMNYFSLMKKETAAPDGEEDPATHKNRSFLGNRLVLSEIDDWMSESESGDEAEEENGEEDGDKKKKKYKVQSKGRKQQGGKKQKKADGESEEEDCVEESDEYDDGAEHDYISSDSSDSEAEDDEVVRRELAGVDEADGLRKLINSEEDDDEEQRDGEDSAEDAKDTDKRKKRDPEGKISEDSDEGAEIRLRKTGMGALVGKMGMSQNRNTKRRTKRELKKEIRTKYVDAVATPMASGSRSIDNSSVSEDTIRRYLMRKPMTTTELLQKFKVKKTGMDPDHLVHSIAQILKKINPVKRVVKGKMYLSMNH